MKMGRLMKYKKFHNNLSETDKPVGCQKIRNACNGKNSKNSDVVKKVDNSHTDDVQHSTPYLYNQLKNILCKDSTTASVEKKIHHNQGEIVHRNAIESQKLQKNLKSKCKRVAYKFVKGLLKERKLKNPDDIDENEHIYFEFVGNNVSKQPINVDAKAIKSTKKSKHNRYRNNVNKFDGMQDIRIRVERATTATATVPAHNHGSPSHQRPIHLFSKPNTNCGTDNNLQNIQSRSPSSEEDNSPTELNNCRRLIDKPPLVKRLAMGLLRTSEESRPLVLNTPSPTSGSTHTISDGYVNEGICDPDKIISSKFGDSCRKSLTSVLDKSYKETCEFDLKKHFLRETCSANSSPKIFGPSQRRIEGLSLGEQNELKGAAWFQAGIPREISLEVLSRQSPGAFLVRQSSTKPGCFALSLRVPPPAPKVAHYLILRTSRGYKIKGFTKEFSSLRALITHHSVMPELLPVPLALPRPQNFVPQRRHLDDFDTYGSLTDFRKMMSDLNV